MYTFCPVPATPALKILGEIPVKIKWTDPSHRDMYEFAISSFNAMMERSNKIFLKQNDTVF